jgi:subtilisin family serine protease
MRSHRRRVVLTVLITLLLTLPLGLSPTSAAPAGASETYIVLYRQNATPADTALSIGRAGGVVVADYDEIGVVIARSSNASFAAAMRRDGRVEGAAATTNFGSYVGGDGAEGPPEGDLPNAPASDSDNLSGLQWDMRQIFTPEAHAITGGSPSVVVGDIDTGLDFTHPDLAPNYDAANSTDCSGGAPAPLTPGNDQNGHGTHTAGTIAAAANEVGIVGVAPNVKIAGIKGSNDSGFFFPEMVVCAFMWAGSHHLDVTNNSYYADPFLYNCRNDAEQRAIWKAEMRAIRYAMTEGVTVVASAGNESDDMSHPTYDGSSPDYPPGTNVDREITNACVKVPVEVPGVVGVSANGHNTQTDDNDDPNEYLKSYYSSYGVSGVDVVAPGGDSRYGINAEATNGRVLSTYPSYKSCSRSAVDPTEPTATYCYLQGTSMAGPHVAGLAALIISRYGDGSTPQNGKMRPEQVAALLSQTADPQPCPTALPTGYSAVMRPDGTPQLCQGGEGHNSWYGDGQVNALRAVTHSSGNGS